MKMKGYDFSLVVDPVGSDANEDKPLPTALRWAQDEIKALSDNAKATVSVGTTLQELIGWLLRSQGQMAEQLKGAVETHQEHGRLSKNLEDNLREVRRAKELSQRYRKQAADVYTEAAQIAGVSL